MPHGSPHAAGLRAVSVAPGRAPRCAEARLSWLPGRRALLERERVGEQLVGAQPSAMVVDDGGDEELVRLEFGGHARQLFLHLVRCATHDALAVELERGQVLGV